MDYFNGPDSALSVLLTFPDEDFLETNNQHFTQVTRKEDC